MHVHILMNLSYAWEYTIANCQICTVSMPYSVNQSISIGKTYWCQMQKRTYFQTTMLHITPPKRQFNNAETQTIDQGKIKKKLEMGDRT